MSLDKHKDKKNRLSVSKIKLFQHSVNAVKNNHCVVYTLSRHLADAMPIDVKYNCHFTVFIYFILDHFRD